MACVAGFEEKLRRPGGVESFRFDARTSTATVRTAPGVSLPDEAIRARVAGSGVAVVRVSRRAR